MFSENHSSARMVVFDAETHLDFTNNRNFGSVDSTTYERRMWTIRRTSAEAVYTRKTRRTAGFGRELVNKLAGEVAELRMAVLFLLVHRFGEEDEEDSRVSNFLLNTMTGRAPKTQTIREDRTVMRLNGNL